MKKEDDHIPLQEVVYKPTTESHTPAVLKPASKSGNSFLYFSALIADLVTFSAGVAFGWTSPILPQLADTNPETNPLGRPITASEASWIAGLACLGAILGPLAAAPTADKIGRKKTLLLAAVPMTLSFLILAFAKTVPLYYLARLILGVGAGSGFTVLPMYLGEIAEDHNRGIIGCTLGASVACGFLFDFALGPFLNVQKFCLLCAVPLLVFLAVFSIWIPESPHFLAFINKNKELKRSLLKLRNKSVEKIQEEIDFISKTAFKESQNKRGISDLFKSKGLRKGLIVVLGLIILQQLSGINAVLAYMQTIFNATGSGLSPEISTIIIGSVQVAVTILTSFFADCLGRRVLLLISSIGSGLSLIALGLYFYLKTKEFNVDAIFWLPVLSLVVFIVAFNVGLGPLPWALVGELFPPNVKCVASMLNSFIGFTTAFVITLCFPMVNSIIGMANCFWLFAVISLFGALFVYWLVPETKGKSLQEIQKMLEGSKR